MHCGFSATVADIFSPPQSRHRKAPRARHAFELSKLRIVWCCVMSARPAGPLDEVVRKWLALSERRLAWFVDVSETPRWQHYYTKAELLDQMREAERLRDRWATLANGSAREAAEPSAAGPPLVPDAAAAPASSEGARNRRAGQGRRRKRSTAR
jgi:hypothetical protein